MSKDDEKIARIALKQLTPAEIEQKEARIKKAADETAQTEGAIEGMKAGVQAGRG